MTNLSDCWLFFQPFLFGLIGTEINLAAVSYESIGWSLAVMVIGIVVSMISCPSFNSPFRLEVK